MLLKTKAPICPGCHTLQRGCSGFVSFLLTVPATRERRRFVVCAHCGAILWMRDFKPVSEDVLQGLCSLDYETIKQTSFRFARAHRQTTISN